MRLPEGIRLRPSTVIGDVSDSTEMVLGLLGFLVQEHILGNANEITLVCAEDNSFLLSSDSTGVPFDQLRTVDDWESCILPDISYDDDFRLEFISERSKLVSELTGEPPRVTELPLIAAIACSEYMYIQITKDYKSHDFYYTLDYTSKSLFNQLE